MICKKCNRVMVYEPYFKTHICRQCGYELAGRNRIVVPAKPKRITCNIISENAKSHESERRGYKKVPVVRVVG